MANLEPGKAITVRLRTVETLRYERGVYRLTFPLVVGPRYIPGGSVADAAQVILTRDARTTTGNFFLDDEVLAAAGTRSGHDVEISVTIDAGVPLTKLESPSHRTIVRKTTASGAAVRLADDDAIPNKDFLLRWSVASERPALGLLAHRDGLDGFFTLLVQPKGDVGGDAEGDHVRRRHLGEHGRDPARGVEEVRREGAPRARPARYVQSDPVRGRQRGLCYGPAPQ